MSDENKDGTSKEIVPVNHPNSGASVSLTNANSNVELDLVNDRDAAMKFFEDMLKGRKTGVTKPWEAALVYTRCQELNLPFASTIDQMCVIGDKVCASIHIKNALALRAGHSFFWECIRDYEPQYKYTDGTSEWLSYEKPIKFLKGIQEEDPYAATLQYSWDEASMKAATADNKVPYWNAMGHNKAYDYVTEYKGYRVRTLRNGKEVELKGTGKFSSAAGHIAQLGFGGNAGDFAGVRDPNSNWGKYEPRMVQIRALDNLFKVLASDLMMGMPEISEMADANNLSYVIDPLNGNATLIHQVSDESDIEDVKEIQ